MWSRLLVESSCRGSKVCRSYLSPLATCRTYSLASHTSRNSKLPPAQLDSNELSRYREYFQKLKVAIDELPQELTETSTSLVTLHKRLHLPHQFTTSLLARCLTCRSSNLPLNFVPSDTNMREFPKRGQNSNNNNNNFVYSNSQRDNHGLNIFGKNLLTYQTIKYLLTKYPRLPTPVLNVAVNAYISDEVLASIVKSWGVQTEKQTIMERFLNREEPLSITLGKLRYFNNVMKFKDGIESISRVHFSETAAYALVLRSIVAVLWTIDSKMADEFISKNILLSRKLDITKLFAFEQPTRELAQLCRREGLARPVSKLIAESGRLSKAPVFIVGVFSGNDKLGEGFGSSLKEAKARAATDSLMKWYCYEPTHNTTQKPVIDPGTIIV